MSKPITVVDQYEWAARMTNLTPMDSTFESMVLDPLGWREAWGGDPGDQMEKCKPLAAAIDEFTARMVRMDIHDNNIAETIEWASGAHEAAQVLRKRHAELDSWIQPGSERAEHWDSAGRVVATGLIGLLRYAAMAIVAARPQDYSDCDDGYDGCLQVLGHAADSHRATLLCRPLLWRHLSLMVEGPMRRFEEDDRGTLHLRRRRHQKRLTVAC